MNFSVHRTALAVVLCLSLVVGATPAIAQDESNESETETVLDDREDELANLTVDDLEGVGQVAGDDGYVQEIDSSLRVVAWEYVDGRFYVTFEADESKSVTLTEWVRMEKGSGQGHLRVHRIPEGTSTVSIEARRVNGDAAISITTTDSVRSGRYSYLSTGMAGINWFDGQATWGLAVLGAATAAVATFWGTKRYLEKQDNEADKKRVEAV